MKQKRSLYYTYTHIIYTIWQYLGYVIREKYQGCFYYVENGNLFLPTCTLYDMVLCGLYIRFIKKIYIFQATGFFLKILLSERIPILCYVNIFFYFFYLLWYADIIFFKILIYILVNKNYFYMIFSWLIHNNIPHRECDKGWMKIC